MRIAAKAPPSSTWTANPINIRSPRDAVRAGICMVPEDRKHHGIVPGMAVGYNMTLAVVSKFAHTGILDMHDEMTAIDTDIRRMRIKTATPMLSISSLSGGNQQKAVISRMLMPKPRVIILDEPTRGVDVGAKYEIYKLMYELARAGVVAIIMGVFGTSRSARHQRPCAGDR